MHLLIYWGEGTEVVKQNTWHSQVAIKSLQCSDYDTWAPQREPPRLKLELYHLTSRQDVLRKAKLKKGLHDRKCRSSLMTKAAEGINIQTQPKQLNIILYDKNYSNSGSS